MRWLYLKKFWSWIVKPRCFGTGGNLSSFDCGMCKKSIKCAGVHSRVYHEGIGIVDWKNPYGDSKTFFSWSKRGEFYPDGRMNNDRLCKRCSNRPRVSYNPIYCDGCLKKGIHTKFKEVWGR